METKYEKPEYKVVIRLVNGATFEVDKEDVEIVDTLTFFEPTDEVVATKLTEETKEDFRLLFKYRARLPGITVYRHDGYVFIPMTSILYYEVVRVRKGGRK